VIRKKTGLQKSEFIARERRLRWLGHVLRMEDTRIPRQAMQCRRGYKRKPGRPRKNWMDIVRCDLKDMGSTTWDKAGEQATNRAEWCQRVDVGLTKGLK